jgi:hypothetical protein
MERWRNVRCGTCGPSDSPTTAPLRLNRQRSDQSVKMVIIMLGTMKHMEKIPEPRKMKGALRSPAARLRSRVPTHTAPRSVMVGTVRGE